MSNYEPTDEFIETLHQIEFDLWTWENVLNHFVNKYLENNSQEREISSSTSVCHDHKLDGTESLLKTNRESRKKVDGEGLFEAKSRFFHEVMNLHMVSLFHALETLLLKTISEEILGYGYKFKPWREASSQIKKDIKKTGKSDGKNNKYIVIYLKSKVNEDVPRFLESKVIDWEMSWERYFYFLANYRHLVIHNNKIFDKDDLNALKSNAKKVFETHFEENESCSYPKDMDSFKNIIRLTLQLGLNLVKFIKDEDDLTFAGYKAPPEWLIRDM
jgi:hypothetical protein